MRQPPPSPVFGEQNGTDSSYSVQTSLEGQFNTGSLAHTLLFGVDFNHSDETITTLGVFSTPLPLNIFDPVYNQFPKPDSAAFSLFNGRERNFDRVGIYLQDQVYLLDNLIVLAGLRYDTISQKPLILRRQLALLEEKLPKMMTR
ncbi:MAG: TonB-dependent receptor [Leptolyngbyaceae cyanobacterium CRU_2_3]|nr:TonB-dependent receptor [Leptolyngbyaceae cyanobacterium CRU_2_3]